MVNRCCAAPAAIVANGLTEVETSPCRCSATNLVRDVTLPMWHPAANMTGFMIISTQVEIYTGSTRRMSPQSADTSNKGFARIIRGISDFQVQNSAFQNASPEPCFLIMRNNIKQWMKLGSSSLWAHTYASIDFRLPSSLTSWFSSSRSFHWKQLPRPHLWFRSIYEQFHIERLIKVKSLGYRIWNRIDKLAGGLARRISPFGSSSGSTVRNCSEIANWYRSHGSGKVLPKPSIQELLFSWSMFVYRLIV